jgi:hypothetical protein
LIDYYGHEQIFGTGKKRVLSEKLQPPAGTKTLPVKYFLGEELL